MPKPNGEPLKILCVCGWGMGSSLLLRMLMESVVKDLGIEAQIDHTDFSAARGMLDGFDVVAGQEMHASEFEGQVPIIVVAENFMDTEPLKQQLQKQLEERGWL